MVMRLFDTLDVPLPVGAALACAAVMLVSWLLVWALSKRGKATRITAAIACIGIIGLVALSVGIALAYPGPAWRYEPGTAVHWLYLHVLNLGGYLALLLPFCAASLVAVLWPHGGRRMTIVAVVLAGLLVILSLILMLVVACNHAGACL